MKKPIINYGFINEGPQKGLCSITADNYEIAVIPFCENGWTSSWQENTLSKVEEVCKELLPEGFIFPYVVGNDGYVYSKLIK